MIATIPHVIEDSCVTRYCGLVPNEAISGLGARLDRTILTSMTNIVGRCLGAFEEKQSGALKTGEREMRARATEIGADAVIEIELDDDVTEHMLMASASDTVLEMG